MAQLMLAAGYHSSINLTSALKSGRLQTIYTSNGSNDFHLSKNQRHLGTLASSTSSPSFFIDARLQNDSCDHSLYHIASLDDTSSEMKAKHRGDDSYLPDLLKFPFRPTRSAL